MGSRYEFGENILQDFLFQLQINDNDITHKDFQEGIMENSMFLLEGIGVHYEDLQYLDFGLKKEGVGSVRVMPCNIVTALWFSGIFPENCEVAFLNNSAVIGGLKYKFNKKTKRLSWVKVKE